MAMTTERWMAAISLALCAACAGGKDSVDITKPVTGAEASNAEKAYNRGLQERKDKNYLEATRFFESARGSRYKPRTCSIKTSVAMNRSWSGTYARKAT